MTVIFTIKLSIFSIIRKILIDNKLTENMSKLKF